MSNLRVVPLVHPAGRDFFESPARLFDQHFGLAVGEDDFLPTSSLLHNYYVRPRRQLVQRQNSGLSEIRNDSNKFQVLLDINQFTPEEIVVKTVDNSVIIHAKHEEKMDEHGYISREFQRRYILPDDVKPECVVSSLSNDGILTIEAPKKALEAPNATERVIPIQRKDTPAVTEGETKSEKK